MKGRTFEWEIARALSLNWTGGMRDDIFQPSNASGAQYTTRKKAGKEMQHQGSDLTFNDPDGKLLIDRWNCELKSGYQKKRKTKTGTTKTQWGILDILDGSEEKPIFMEFWNQCIKDSESTNRIPVLIFRRNNRKACIVILTEIFHNMMKLFGIPLFDYMEFSGEMDITIINFKEFLSWVNLKIYMGERK